VSLDLGEYEGREGELDCEFLSGRDGVRVSTRIACNGREKVAEREQDGGDDDYVGVLYSKG